MVNVYSKDNCPACTMTYKMLDDLNIRYEKINVMDDKKHIDYLLGLGYKSFPVVVLNDNTSWSGFVPDKIKSLK